MLLNIHKILLLASSVETGLISELIPSGHLFVDLVFLWINFGPESGKSTVRWILAVYAIGRNLPTLRRNCLFGFNIVNDARVVKLFLQKHRSLFQFVVILFISIIDRSCVLCLSPKMWCLYTLSRMSL